ncbi:MAG: hypothetical protein K9I74_10735 [Bacteroidales bacterium]|nr:hypothetical protein [Bacteroidales bacterium]
MRLALGFIRMIGESPHIPITHFSKLLKPLPLLTRKKFTHPENPGLETRNR